MKDSLAVRFTNHIKRNRKCGCSELCAEVRSAFAAERVAHAATLRIALEALTSAEKCQRIYHPLHADETLAALKALGEANTR